MSYEIDTTGWRVLWLSTLLAISPYGTAETGVRTVPQFLTMEELIELSDTPQPIGALREKVDALLNTPFVDNGFLASGTAKRPEVPAVGPVMRVAAWNIERGSNFDLIQMAFSDPEALAKVAVERNAAVEEKHRAKPEEIADVRLESEHLQQSDVIILNEVDLGMGRTDYRDVAKDLAKALGMSYAYGVEFIEVDKIYLGLEELRPPKNDKDVEERFTRDVAVDRNLYKGLHGTAILSRYPIRSARNIRLKPCYEWYEKEKKEISELEKGRRIASKNVFLERIAREVRHGNRFALVAELEVPESPTGVVTVVGVHLENKCRPTCRKEQMEELLLQLQPVQGPLVMGGDLNSTGSDGAPMSIGREIKKRVRNPGFWAGQAISWFSPVAFPNLVIGSTNYIKNYQDPTALSIPLIAVNREARLFEKLEKFRFADGGSFDFGGTRMKSSNGREGTLSNSNERAAKGFTPTFEFERDFGGVVGQLRLDWLLVKPAVYGQNHALHFAPWFGATLDHLNEAFPGQISDHHPISVDLPLKNRAPNTLFRSDPPSQ
jgi:endonuclease/exonuclease/phosphatase family metal-dependent hydrolase